MEIRPDQYKQKLNELKTESGSGKVPQQQSLVVSSLKIQFKTISELNATVATLEDRLRPVLGPLPPQQSENTGQSLTERINIAFQIGMATERLTNSTAYLQSLIQRLEI